MKKPFILTLIFLFTFSATVFALETITGNVLEIEDGVFEMNENDLYQFEWPPNLNQDFKDDLLDAERQGYPIAVTYFEAYINGHWHKIVTNVQPL